MDARVLQHRGGGRSNAVSNGAGGGDLPLLPLPFPQLLPVFGDFMPYPAAVWFSAGFGASCGGMFLILSLLFVFKGIFISKAFIVCSKCLVSQGLATSLQLFILP